MIEFEVLSKDNIDEVWRLEQECFDDPWTKKMFESEIDNRVSVYIVARDKENERVVGFGGVWTVLDCADITDIAVAADYRRCGLGCEIMRLLIQICTERGVETMNLEVKTTIAAAISLYKKMGFEQCGIRKKYYHNRFDAMLMALKINPDTDNLTETQKD